MQHPVSLRNALLPTLRLQCALQSAGIRRMYILPRPVLP
jgi:hypothetical protein